MTRQSASNCDFFSSFSFFSSSVSSRVRPSLVHETSLWPSNSLSCCTAYSSIGSTMYSTSEPLCDLVAVLRVLVHAELEILAEGLVELGEVV